MMKRWVLVAFLFVSQWANAAGIPVIDSTNLAENLAQKLKQVEEYSKQLQQYAKQIEQFQQQLKDAAKMPNDLMNGVLQDILNNLQNMGGLNGSGTATIGQLGQYNASAWNSSGGGDYYGGNVGGAAYSGNANFYSLPGDTGSMGEYINMYGNYNHYYQMNQYEPRPYEVAGSQAANTANANWVVSLETQEEAWKVSVEQQLNELKGDIESANDDGDGGTNKLLAVNNKIMFAILQETLAMRRMMIDREIAQSTAFLNAQARQDDMEAQTRRLLTNDDMFQAQLQGHTPLTFKKLTSQ
jgi:Conjugal transfer/entry exclusion protein